MRNDIYNVRDFARGEVPYGGIHDRPILSIFLDAIRLLGLHEVLAQKIRASGNLSWMDPRCPSFVLRRQDKNQTAALICLRPPDTDKHIERLLSIKAPVTLVFLFGPVLFSMWIGFVSCARCFQSAKSILELSGLKYSLGDGTRPGECTSHTFLTASFGCDADDVVAHYLESPVLWSIANQFFKYESSVLLSERMCFRQPSVA